MEWKVAFPLHPEYRTLPMVWYIPPLSPIQAAAESGKMGMNGIIPDTKSLRIPVKYLANLLTAGKEAPVVHALDRMLAMRAYMRSKSVDGVENFEVLKQVGMSQAMVEDMYHIMAIANYEDRFVIPSSHKEMVEDSFNEKGSCGFSFGNGCSDGVSDSSLFGKKKQGSVVFADMPKSRKKRESEGV
jgi:nitrate reductase / nitrite oxidoreductase, beta subunit